MADTGCTFTKNDHRVYQVVETTDGPPEPWSSHWGNEYKSLQGAREHREYLSKLYARVGRKFSVRSRVISPWRMENDA